MSLARKRVMLERVTWIRFRTAGVGLDMSLSWNTEDVPLNVQVVLRQVHAVGDRVVALHRVDVDQVDLKWISNCWISYSAIFFLSPTGKSYK